MQVAIHRSQDAGKLQEQLNRQGQQFQETLTEKQLKETVLKRQQVNQYDHVEKRDIHDDSEEGHQREQDGKHNHHKRKKKKQKMQHPYIGNRIDFTR